MVGSISYLVCFLSFICTFGIVFTTAFYEWKRNSIQSSQAYFSQAYSAEGLWYRCSSSFTGIMTCDNYDSSLIEISPALHGMRAMMCLAIIFSLISCFSSAAILPCTNLSERLKNQVARATGILLLLAGGLCIGAVSWYAAEVVYDFFHDKGFEKNIKYEFGSALYVGWVSGGLAVLAGGLLLCCSCGGEDDEYESSKYTYRPPQSSKGNARSAEYI